MKTKTIKALVLTLLLAVLATVAIALSSCSHSHMLTDVKVIKAATCTEEGQMEAACECGYSQKTQIPKSEHMADSWEITKAPTCEASGTKRLACRACDFTIETDTIPASAHDIVNVEAKGATCAETGHNAYEYCTACNYTTYSEIQKKAHTPGAAATCATPQYCNVCETVVSEALGHVRKVTEGIPATCTEKGMSDKVECTRCKELLEESVEIPERQHVVSVIPGIAPTCSAKGYSESLVCLICDEEIADAVVLPAGSGEHSFSGGRNSKCEYCGIKEEDFDECEHVKTVEDEDGDEEEESLFKEVNGKEASCSKYGYSDWEYCTECAAVKGFEVISPSEHKLETVKGNPATLTTVGFTDGLVCKNSTCRLTVRHQDIIPVISIALVGNSAAEINGGALSYVKNDDETTCAVNGIGSCTSKDIVIPEYIDGLRVTAIEENAFYGSTINSIVIPVSVREIGKNAFAMCTLLTKVTMPDGAELGKDVFLGTSGVTVDFTHTLVYVAKVTPEECDELGVKAHYVCAYCHNRYTDKDARTQTFDIDLTTSHDFEDGACTECKKAEDQITVWKLLDLPAVKVDKGTFAKDLKLPSTVTGIIEYEGKDGNEAEKEVELKVIWDLKNYNASVAGTYTVTGHVCYGIYEIGRNADETITLKIEVK